MLIAKIAKYAKLQKFKIAKNAKYAKYTKYAKYAILQNCKIANSKTTFKRGATKKQQLLLKGLQLGGGRRRAARYANPDREIFKDYF